jgi:hypothetical protein
VTSARRYRKTGLEAEGLRRTRNPFQRGSSSSFARAKAPACIAGEIKFSARRRNMAVANFSVIRIYTPQRYLHADDEQIKNTVEKNGEVTRNRTKTGQWKN